jgi:hypothetical protein
MAHRGDRNTSYTRRTWRLEAGDVVEGLGEYGLATGLSSVTGCGVVFSVIL